MNYSWAFQQERGHWSEVYSKLINGRSVLWQAATSKNWHKEKTTWKQGELIKNLFSWKCIYNVSIKSNKGPEKFDISFCVTYQIFLSGRLGTWTFLHRAALFSENFLSHPETPEATNSFFSNIFS